jgi:hypothetical protein
LNFPIKSPQPREPSFRGDATATPHPNIAHRLPSAAHHHRPAGNLSGFTIDNTNFEPEALKLVAVGLPVHRNQQWSLLLILPLSFTFCSNSSYDIISCAL